MVSPATGTLLARHGAGRPEEWAPPLYLFYFTRLPNHTHMTRPWADSHRDQRPGRGAGRGGGGTTFFKVGTHCQTTAPTLWCCPPFSIFLPPPIFFSCKPPPPKINILNAKVSTKVMQSLLHAFLYKESHVFNKIEGIQTSLISYCTQFEVDRPFFCPKRSWQPLNLGVHRFHSAWPFGSG